MVHYLKNWSLEAQLLNEMERLGTYVGIFSRRIYMQMKTLDGKTQIANYVF